MPFTLAEAKQRFRIPDLWRHLKLPGEPGTSCHCPFHRDSSASFSVFAQGLRWKCFAGCGCGDAITLLQLATGLKPSDACRMYLELATGFAPRADANHSRLATPPPKRDVARIEPPALSPGTVEQWGKLSVLRRISVPGIALAAQRGLLAFGTWKGREAWFVLDTMRFNVQARRLDGHEWPEIGGRKAYSLPGSTASWPIGARESTPFPTIALCEGGPDVLAAFHFIHLAARERDCSAVAMLGAALDIHPRALVLFSGKRVRIFAHHDSTRQLAGAHAAARWAKQLMVAGANVDVFSFAGLHRLDGSPVKDLNNCSVMDFEASARLRTLLP